MQRPSVGFGKWSLYTSSQVEPRLRNSQEVFLFLITGGFARKINTRPRRRATGWLFLAGYLAVGSVPRLLLAYSLMKLRTSNHASDWVLIQSVAEE
jgi:hypothetical protein